MVPPRHGLAAFSDLRRGFGSLLLQPLFLHSRLAFRSSATGLTSGSSKTSLPSLSSIVTLAERTAGDWQAPRNIAIFYSHDLFHLLNLVAIILCCSRRLYPIAIFAGTVSLLLLQNRQNLPVFYYQAIVLLPIFALAWAGGLRTISTWLRPMLRETFARRALLYIAMSIPITMASAHSAFVPAGPSRFAQ